MKILKTKGNRKKIQYDGKIGRMCKNKINELKKNIEKCQFVSERKIIKGEKKLKDRYISVKDIFRLLDDFGI